MSRLNNYYATVNRNLLTFKHFPLSVLKNKMLVINAGIYKTLIRTANREDPDQTALIWVCAVCLGSCPGFF